jgi:hypothetical protein
MIVAVDLDEVVFNFLDPYLDFINKKYGKKLTRADFISDWSAERLGFIPRGSSRDNLLEFGRLGGFRNLGFMPGAEKGLFDLSNHHSMLFLTSREPEARYDTIAALNEAGFGHIPLYFSNNHGVSKGMILSNVGAHYFIDDSPEYISDARRRSNTCVSILMSQIPAAITAIGGQNYTSGWDDLRNKRPELFMALRI